MRKLKVESVMTRDVVAVGESTPFMEIIRSMRSKSVTALPVIDRHGHVVGVVSEADLLLKEEGLDLELPPIFERRRHRQEREKAAGRVAKELMTSPAVMIHALAPIAEAARTMHRNEVKRLPVVDERGRLVGIVSRADLIKVYLRSDEEIKAEVRDTLAIPLRIHPDAIRVSVRDGVVRLEGGVRKRSEIGILVDLVHRIDGVVAVESDLHFEVDDQAVTWPVPGRLVGP